MPDCTHRRVSPPRDSPGEAEGAAGKPTIAVLPFADLTADPEQEYFGMVEGNL